MDDEEYFADPDHVAEFEDHQFDDHQLDADSAWTNALAEWDAEVDADWDAKVHALIGNIDFSSDEDIVFSDDDIAIDVTSPTIPDSDGKWMTFKGQQYWWSSNYTNDGNVLKTCNLHSLNSTIMNTDATQFSAPLTWHDIPRHVLVPRLHGKKDKKDWLWFPSGSGGDKTGKFTEVNANWSSVFRHILDPLHGQGSKTRILRGAEFLEWAKKGTADPKFKFATAMLPHHGAGHQVSIVKSYEKDSNELILLDSEFVPGRGFHGPQSLSRVAHADASRWCTTAWGSGMKAHVYIYEHE